MEQFSVQWWSSTDGKTTQLFVHCPICGEPVGPKTPQNDAKPVLSLEAGLVLFDHMRTCPQRGKTYHFALEEVYVLPDGTLLSAYKDHLEDVPFVELSVCGRERMMLMATDRQKRAAELRAKVEVGDTKFAQSHTAYAAGLDEDAAEILDIVARADALAKGAGPGGEQALAGGEDERTI